MAGSARAFMDFLREHRNGATHDDLSDKLQELVAAVMEEGKSGKITLTVSIKPVGKNDGLEVAAEVKSTLPKKQPGVSIFFASPENNLIRQDPRQQALELREISPASVARALA
jgi:hypothetical protein